MASRTAWFDVLLAGVCECSWAIGLKYVDELRQPLGAAAGRNEDGASLGGLTLALRPLPAGTANAVWTCVGAAGTAAPGMVLFAEPVDALRLASLALVITGIVGLKLAP